MIEMRARTKLIFALLAAALPIPAAAADWRHEPSGVSIAEKIGDMQRGEERDLSKGKAVDIMIQYGSGTEPVTVYVYRSAFPNPALWFERTRHAMKLNVGLGTDAVAPRAFTFGGAPSPNGLREEAELTGRAPWKSTAVAIAQAGEWIVKARITSQTLDRKGVGEKMDRLLAAIRLSAPPAAPLPLQVPGACPSRSAYGGKPMEGRADAAFAGMMSAAVAAAAMSRGQGGLAAEPAAWCREESQFPPDQVSLYRRRDGAGWVALIGDSGMAVMGLPFEGEAKGAALLSSTTRSVRVVSLFDAPPAPEPAVVAALPVLLGDNPGMIEVAVDAGGKPR